MANRKKKRWTLKISPEYYVSRFPTGPHIDFGREIVDKKTNISWP